MARKPGEHPFPVTAFGSISTIAPARRMPRRGENTSGCASTGVSIAIAATRETPSATGGGHRRLDPSSPTGAAPAAARGNTGRSVGGAFPSEIPGLAAGRDRVAAVIVVSAPGPASAAGNGGVSRWHPTTRAGTANAKSFARWMRSESKALFFYAAASGRANLPSVLPLYPPCRCFLVLRG